MLELDAATADSVNHLAKSWGVSKEEAVRRAVERVKGERWEEFAGRHGDSGRDLFLWLARRHTGRSHAELGGEAGGLKPGAASEAVRILERRLSTDRSLARQAKSAEQFLRF